MDVTSLLFNSLGDQGISELSKKVGVDNKSVQSTLEGIVPSLLGAMSKNTSSKEGAQGFMKAIDRDHDGSILDNLGDFLGDSKKQEDGNGILKHVLGDNRNQVEESLAMKTGMSSNKVSELMKIAAPIVMGIIGKQRKTQSTGFDENGLTSLLGGLAGTADKNTGLDLGDIMNMVGSLSNGGNNKSGGIGGLIKGLFGN